MIFLLLLQHTPQLFIYVLAFQDTKVLYIKLFPTLLTDFSVCFHFWNTFLVVEVQERLMHLCPYVHNMSGLMGQCVYCYLTLL
jgi:hypothetical protein